LGDALDLGFDTTKVRALDLYKNIKPIAVIEGISDSMQAQASDRLTKEFEKSVWYSPDADSTLLVGIKASFSSDRRRSIEDAVHEYTVKVPYTVMIPQMRSIPHTTYQTNCTTYGCTSTPFTTYSYETYTVPATRYRDEARSFQYQRWQYNQALAFHGELLSTFGTVEAHAFHTPKSNDTGTEHPHSVPEIGLHPQILSLPDPQKWLESQIDEAVRLWGKALSNAWLPSIARHRRLQSMKGP
jgi:hypothetical protein